MPLISILFFMYLTVSSNDLLNITPADSNHSEIQTMRHQENIKPELIELILKDRPNDITYWINRLKSDEVIDEELRRLILIGEPGVGKSMLARAMAIKAQVAYHFIHASEIGSKYQNSNQEDLRQAYKPFLYLKTPAVIILDELECIFDNSQSAQSTKALMGMIDAFERNPYILFIGTLNSLNKMPHALKTRLANCIVEISLPGTDTRKEMILYYLPKSHGLTNDYIYYLANITKNLPPREIKSFIDAIRKKAHPKPINKNQCDDVIKQMNLNSWNLFKINISDEQKQTLGIIAQYLPSYLGMGIQLFVHFQSKKLQREQSIQTKTLHEESLTFSKDAHNTSVQLQKNGMELSRELHNESVSPLVRYKNKLENTACDFAIDKAKEFKESEMGTAIVNAHKRTFRCTIV